ncbi:hypothetical protein [Cerasicoccus frondis]|uniref:hypothetical protein n=1 Tax=Cerasicoccus frondis TaxID=490090 RepID=UPI00285299C9|nr:hypothetical protein [Cerasicoccus frondis]
MALTTQQRIELQELLLQREALYARIARIEAQIEGIFGEDYPLPPPPVEVAECGKPKKAAKKKKPAKALAIRLRPLEGLEVAYRICYAASSYIADEIHGDRKAIASYLEAPMAVHLIERIETIDAQGEPIEAVFLPASTED